MLIIPAIDLRAGKCVRLTQGRRDATKIYNEDPVGVARRFQADGAAMLHVVDLDGAFAENNSRNRAVLRDMIRTINIPVQFGGGLRSLRQVKDAIDLGASRVVIGTVAIEAPDILAKIMHLFGTRHIAIGIDAEDGKVVMHGWETKASISAVTHARNVAAIGVERIVYTDVERDGMLTGPNIEHACLIAARAAVKVTVSGGVSSLEDLRQLKAVSGCGIDSVIVGKALYEGRFTLKEAIAAAS